MPRSKSGQKRAPVNTENLIIAARRCISGEISMCQAANRYKIAKTTLTRHISAFRKSGAAEFKYTANNNTKQVFSQEEEESLKKYLITATRLHYGLSKTEARRLAYQFAFANSQKYPESWITDKIAGKEWLRHFLKRHPDLLLKMETPETTFLDNFKDVLVSGHFPPEKIWNCDEMCVVSADEHNQNTTMIAAVSAAGNCIPPMLIFPRANFRVNLLKGCPVGSIGGANPSGLSNAGLFLRFLAHFVNYVTSTKEDPVILTLDNYDGHISIEAIRFCKENGVKLLTFDPRAVESKQPLDNGVFEWMKSYYGSACCEWKVTNPGRTITINDVAELIGIAFPKAFTPANIRKGFDVTELFSAEESILEYPESSCSKFEVDDALMSLIDRTSEGAS